MGDVMGDFKRGQLNSGTGVKGKTSGRVKSRKQAIAIGLSICDNEETADFSCPGGCGGMCGCPKCKEVNNLRSDLISSGYSDVAVDAVLFAEGSEEKRKKWGSIYKKGLSDKQQKSAARASERAEKAEKEGKSKKEVYKSWPSDKKTRKKLKEQGKKMPKSKATIAYEKKYGKSDNSEFSEMDFSEGLKKKAKDSGIPLGILRTVYAKGVAAWKTGHRPGTTPQQWGYARVNSFITGSGKARQADMSLWKRAKAAKAAKKK